MKTKALFSVFVAFCAVIVLAHAASAALTFSTSPLTKTIVQGESATITFTVTNTNATANFTNLSAVFSSMTKGSYSLAPTSVDLSSVPSSIAANDDHTFTLEMTIPSSQSIGTYKGNLTFEGTYGTTNEEYVLPLEITVDEKTPDWEDNFCLYDDAFSSAPNNFDLSIDIDDIQVTGFGDDDAWFPFDNVEVTFVIENNNDDYDIDNIQVEWGVYNKDEGTWVIDVDDEKDFDLKDGDDETLEVSFTIDDKDLDIDLEDMNDGDTYVLYARAIGEVDDDDNNDACDWDSEEVESVVERDFVIATNIDEPTSALTCGSTLSLSADVYNIGERDQDDVSVRVFVRNMDYDQYFTIGDINAFDKERLTIEIPIPRNADEKTYAVVFEVYGEDSDLYVNDFDDDEAVTTIPFEVSGGCSSTSGSTDKVVDISANLESGGYAGETMIIRAMITNIGDKTKTFLVNAEGYNDWASSAKLSKSSLLLSPGESGEVTMTFDVLDDATGDRMFNVEVVSDGTLVASQPVSVTIESSPGFSLGGNLYVLLFVLFDILLVLVIIIVAVRLRRARKKKAQKA